MKKIFCLDTNILLYDPKAIFSFDDNDVVIPFIVLEELDEKKFRPDDVGKNARQTSRILDELRKQGNLSTGVVLPKGGTLKVVVNDAKVAIPLPDDMLKSSADNAIIATALSVEARTSDPVYVITKDINMRIKCDILGLKCDDYKKHRVAKGSDLVYGGVAVATVDASTLGEFFSQKSITLQQAGFADADVCPNEFIVLKNCGSGSGLARVKDNVIQKITEYPDIWGIHARNKEQRFALDILLDNDVKLVSLIGAAGTGKTLLAVAAGLKQVVEDKTFSKLLITRPIQPVGKDIGYLPGTKEEKMEPWIQPIVDNLEYLFGHSKKDGSVLNMYFDDGTIEVEAITYIRGRSIPNALIIIDEAQNLSVHELKTLITRVGEGTKVILTGDIDQIDNSLVDAVSNGLTYAVEKFKNHEIAGHITLLKGERSELATLAASIL